MLGPSEPQQAAALYQRAASEGYELALRIRSSDLDALVGVAETRVSLGKLAAAAGEQEAAAALVGQGADAYRTAIAQAQLVRRLGTFAERRAWVPLPRGG